MGVSRCVVGALCMVTAIATHPSEQGPFAQAERYFGFRFEAGASDGAALQRFMGDVVAAADQHSAFGWIQERPGATPALVGEVRATKGDGAQLLALLHAGPAYVPEGGYTADVLTYTDTRIRYHFADFRVLDAARKTCFPTPPHKCAAEEEL